MQQKYVIAIEEGTNARGIETFTLNGQGPCGEPEIGDDDDCVLPAPVEVSWISGIESTGRSRLRSAVVLRQV